MARTCDILNKKTVSGNNVSHSKRAVKRTFKANVHKKTVLVPGKEPGTFRKITLNLSHKAIRMIDKIAIEKVLAKYTTK